MSKLKFFSAFGLLLLFVITVATAPEARNFPRTVDNQNEYSHPWGGDENSGDTVDPIETPVQPYVIGQHNYAYGSKSGLVFGAIHVIWNSIEVFFTSYTTGARYDEGLVGDGAITAQNSTGSNSVTPAESVGKGGQW